MSLKNALKKATLITAISLGPMAKADTLSSESVDFLNQGKRPITEALISRPASSQTADAKYKIIETLCKAGADINFKDADGETPLQVAANRMDGKAMTLLKKYGADTSIKNEWGRTPDETYREGLNNMAKNTKRNIK